MTAPRIPATPVGEFLAALGSRTPSPGGGAVAALAGAMGAAQALMIAEYGTWKPEDADPKPRLKALAQELCELAQEDADRYGEYSAARAKRKEDPAAYAAAQAAIADVPCRALERCAEGLGFLPAVLLHAPKWFAGDARIATSCLLAGAEGARTLLGSNLASLPAESREGFAARAKAADEAVERLRRQLDPLLLARLSGD